MYITHFRAEHFRCLYDTDWIPIHNLTVLIGENDGGKTATIDALEILLTNKSPDTEDFSFVPGSREQHEQEMVLEAKFSLEPSDMSVLQDLCRYGSDQLIIRRAFSSDSPGPLTYRTMVHPDERLSADLAAYTIPVLGEIAEEHGIDVPSRPKADIVDAIETWLATQPLVEGYRELPRAARHLLPQVQVFRSAQALDPQREVDAVLRTVFVAEIDGETYRGKLGDISAQIEASLNERVSRLTPVVQKYRPEITEVRVDPRFDYSRGLATSRLQLIGQDGHPISLDKRGEGIKRQVTLAVYEWNSELLAARPEEGARPLLLAFDEPDSHLDYYSQRKIFEIIRSLVKPGIQIVVCTHSLNLINRVPITNINHYCLDPDDYCTRVTALQSDDPATLELFVDEIGRNMGLENSLMFHERCFLVVEGSSEMNALPRLFSVWHDDGLSLTPAGIRLLNGENNVGARNFAKFLNDNNRNVVFMLDSDSQKHPKGRLFSEQSLRRAGFDIHGQVFFVGDREFEDAFSDTLWARVGNTGWPRKDGRDWRPDDFAALRSQDKKFSDGLRESFRATKPEIAYKLAKCVADPVEIPTQITRCFKHALALANS